MKKFILMMAMVLAATVSAFAQNSSEKVDTASVTTVAPLTTEQHIQSIDSVLQSVSAELTAIKSLDNTTGGFNLQTIGEEVLIPIVGIVFVFGMPVLIILFIFIFKHKNKKAQCEVAVKALEMGKDIPEGLFKNDTTTNGSNQMSKGIMNFFLGIGLGIFLWSLTGEFGLGCIGFMVMFIGLGQIIIHKIQNPSQEPFIRMTKNEDTGESHLKFGGIELNNKEKAEKNTTEE